MFLEFIKNLNNPEGGSSLVDDISELERYVHANGRISMSIAPDVEKPISQQTVRFNQAIDVYVRKTFPVRYLRWADVSREYIEVIKGDLQRIFVLDFNNQAMNRFVEQQMLSTFIEFRGDCHKHFKKYSNLEEAQGSRTNKAVRQKQPYNHSSGLKSFLQRQHELTEQKGESTTVWSCSNKHKTFVSQGAKDEHSQPSLEGSRPLSGKEICETVLGRRPGYSKDLG
ncbi:CACTA en-spm transposon protein [Cucumis melo var. makuwa]|uniref:CACTA en-spm transposon protein n=1 Tax=Cucumis melo var. makuwa TaxID=1194695 RepID=A0A5D3E688_CUCMM|nr:CACTA en-spm transposon protein [Cucumis melo var. makuwa]TYK31647.1 CACTA en-spm transposon protein [Cucumis melo var. makuwa]